MTPEKIDYVAILNDLKAKRAALDASIVAFEAALASGSLGQAVEGVASSGGSFSSSASGTPIDLPSGAFNGKTLLEGIKLYLSAARSRKSTKDIVNGIREGGMVSTSKKFDSVVQATLQKLKSQGHVLKFADGWGLSEWYPAGFRAGTAKAKKEAKKTKRRKSAAKTPKAKTTPEPQVNVADTASPVAKAGGAQVAIESHYDANPGAEFSTVELAKALGISIGGANLICAKLAHQGKLEKTPTGKYRSKKLHAMPKAV